MQGLSRADRYFQQFPPEIQKEYVAIMCANRFLKAEIAESQYFEEDLAEVKNSPKIPDSIPVYIIAAGLPEKASDPKEQKLVDQEFKVFFELQHDLVQKYPGSKLIIAENSSHMINHFQPEIIVDAVKEMVENYRRGQ